MKKVLKFILILIGSFAGLILLILLIIRINSSGEPEPVIDRNSNTIPNSVSLIIDTVINGAPQRLTIRGQNENLPILLRVHGGPASAYVMPWSFDTVLEKRFIVCYWDQRGNGPAATSRLPDSVITLEHIVDDGIVVSKLLKKTFNNRQLFLFGHSWGTAVCAYMANQSPEIFDVYIGIGQIANQPESELKTYSYLLKMAKEKSDTSVVEKLNKLGPPPYQSEEEELQAVYTTRSLINKYAPGRQPLPGLTNMMVDFMMYDGNSFSYKFNFLQGKKPSPDAFSILWPTCANLNLIRDIPQWQIPVFIIQGSDDLHTISSLAKTYFDSLSAPTKDWYLFKNSTHFPHQEEPEHFAKVIDEILEKTNSSQ